MKKTSAIVCLIVSIVATVILTVGYFLIINSVIEENGKKNINEITLQTSTYVNAYTKNNYDEVSKYISDYSLTADDTTLDNLYNRFNKTGLYGFGYYDATNNSYTLKTSTDVKSSTFSNTIKLDDRIYNQKISILDSKNIFTNPSVDETIVFYNFTSSNSSIHLFAIESFNTFKDVLYNGLGKDYNPSYLIMTENAYIVANTFDSTMTYYSGFFDTYSDINSLNSYIDSCVNKTGLVTINGNKYLISHASLLDKNYSSDSLSIYTLISDNYISNYYRSVRYITYIYGGCMIAVGVLFIVSLLSTYNVMKKKNSKLTADFKDDIHYVLVLNKKAKVISMNKKFSSLGVRSSYLGGFDILELNGNANLIDKLLTEYPSLTMKVNDKTGMTKNIKFTILKLSRGYQLIGEEIGDDVNVVSSITNTTQNEDSPEVYVDDIYGIYNVKCLIHTLNDYLQDTSLETQNKYLIYVGNKKQEELSRLYGEKILSLINIEILNKLKSLLGKDAKIFNIKDNNFAFIYTFKDNYHDLNKTFTKFDTEMKKPTKILSQEMDLQVIFGLYPLSLIRGEHTTPINIIDKVRLACDNAKNVKDRSYKIYDEGLAEIYSKDIRVADDIKNGLQKGEFQAVFQPNYSLKEDKVNGFECLIRWNNPKYKYESPLTYVTVAEKTGLINDIGIFTLQESFKLMKELNDPSLHVSVNVSPAQLAQRGFTQKLLNMYKEYGVPYSSICVEITETYLIDSMEEVNSKLEYLRSFGVKVYLDDFGMGFSSLKYLGELPVDVIKLDKEFIDGIKTNKSYRSIITNIINIANDLGLQVVAEGVEDEQEIEFLENRNCSNIQGYYFSKPVSKENARKALSIKRKKEVK
jgi:EAL domain-containing protein (putative c-di-GMP-specific phosphodiesterase class I)/effector-binding domain-containing protein